MGINANFKNRVLVHSTQQPWVDSPMVGVQRRPLDRIGGEVARATTIVRYAPGSAFSAHTHTGGEEFLVLEGVFSDEHGDYPAGSYLRNPPTTHHTPHSNPGCVIFVKLWQFDMADRTSVKLDTQKMGAASDATRPGVQVTRLFEDSRETVQIETWAPGTTQQLALPEGAELLLLEGTLTESADTLETHSWLRIPMGGTLNATAGPAGAKFWIKLRALRFVDGPAV
jgi:quercetin dioxygenase-like cupin family protein